MRDEGRGWVSDDIRNTHPTRYIQYTINIYSLKPINAPFHVGVLPKEGSADVVGERGAGTDGKHPRFGPRAGERGDITGGEDT